MIRMLLVAGACASLLAAAAARETRPSACALMTSHDAAILEGKPQTADPGDASNPNHCSYSGPGGALDPGAEITLRDYSDAGAAHTAFPKWVFPLGPTGNLATKSVLKVGDEATIMHSTHGIGAIYFRHGQTLVKIGTYPAARDSLLESVAATVVGRM